MMDATYRIKNLSIALEAIHSLDMRTLGDRVYALLYREVEKAEEEAQERPIPPARSAAVTTDDDIPF